MNKVISSPRLIYGLLQYMHVNKVLLTFTDSEGKSVDLPIEAISSSSSYRDTSYIIKNELNGPLINIDASFNNKRVEFSAVSVDNFFFLPEMIQVKEVRDRGRVSLEDEVRVEIRGNLNTSLGILKDISDGFFKIELEDSCISFSENERVTVHQIYNDSLSPSLLLEGMFYKKRDSNYVFKFQEREEGKRDLRRFEKVESISICSVNDQKHIGSIITDNIGLNGFSGRILIDDRNILLHPGVKFVVASSDAVFEVRWIKGMNIGCKICNINDSLNKWYLFIKNKISKFENSTNHVTTNELATLFTESSFLTGSRQQVYGENLKKYIPIDLDSVVPSLHYRYSVADESNLIIAHSSIFRFVDNIWLLQEATHRSSEGFNIYDMYEEIILQAAELSKSSTDNPAYFGGLFNKKITGHCDYWKKLAEQNCDSTVLNSYHVKLTESMHNCNNSEIQLLQWNSLTFRDKCKAIENHSDIINQFGLMGSLGAMSYTNKLLSQFGEYYRVEALNVYYGGKDTGIIILNPRIPYNLNLTGILNTIFIFVPNTFNGDLNCILPSIAHVSNGICDVQIISDKEIVVDNILNEFIMVFLKLESQEEFYEKN